MATLRKRGNKWQVQIRRQGSPSLSQSFHTLKDAEAWARSMELQADRGELESDPRTLKQLTLGCLVRRYKESITPLKKTAAAERLYLDAFLRHPICSKKISELRAADFARYRDERLREIKPSSLKRSLVPIHNLFEVARTEWRLPIRDNPLKKLRLDAVDQRRERRLKPGEFERLVKAAEASRVTYLIPLLYLATETAMRRGELLAIRAEHVDLHDRSLLIPYSKNGYSRRIPLSVVAIRELRPLLDKEGLLFPISGNALRLAWVRLTRRAQVWDLHFHDLRHEAISRLFERGLAVPEVALISGHREVRMLFR